MKNINITLQPLSLLVGAAIVGLSLVTTGAFTPQGSTSDRDVNAVEITNQPNPTDYFSIVQGTPFVVPSGKTLVLTAIGDTNDNNPVGLLFDGVQKVLSSGNVYYGNGTSVKDIAQGVTATANTTVTVHSNASSGIAFGYLIDA